jgi:RNA polymerase sigma-70 factor (ECF subfamily)
MKTALIQRERSARPFHRARTGDESVVAAFLEKEPEAAEALYDRFASRIYGLGLVLLRNPTDAEDLVQETFLKVWRTSAAFDPRRGSLDVWILLTARGLAIDLLRRRTLEAKKLSSLPRGMDVSDEPGPEWHAEQRDLIQRVLEAMRRLPPRQRSAVARTYLGEESSAQVAKSQGIPRGTVKNRVRAGMATLRRTLGERASADADRPASRRDP